MHVSHNSWCGRLQCSRGTRRKVHEVGFEQKVKVECDSRGKSSVGLYLQCCSGLLVGLWKICFGRARGGRRRRWRAARWPRATCRECCVLWLARSRAAAAAAPPGTTPPGPLLKNGRWYMKCGHSSPSVSICIHISHFVKYLLVKYIMILMLH